MSQCCFAVALCLRACEISKGEEFTTRLSLAFLSGWVWVHPELELLSYLFAFLLLPPGDLLDNEYVCL